MAYVSLTTLSSFPMSITYFIAQDAYFLNNCLAATKNTLKTLLDLLVGGQTELSRSLVVQAR